MSQWVGHKDHVVLVYDKKREGFLVFKALEFEQWWKNSSTRKEQFEVIKR